jgi:hypothetical protein
MVLPLACDATRNRFDFLACPPSCRYIRVWGFISCGKKAPNISKEHAWHMQRKRLRRFLRGPLCTSWIAPVDSVLQGSRRGYKMRSPRNPHQHSYLCNVSASARAKCLACAWNERYGLNRETVYEFDLLLTEADRSLLHDMKISTESTPL